MLSSFLAPAKEKISPAEAQRDPQCCLGGAHCTLTKAVHRHKMVFIGQSQAGILKHCIILALEMCPSIQEEDCLHCH